LEAYKMLTEHATDPAKAAYEMAQFAVEHCLPDAAKPYLIGFLKHDDAAKHPGLVLPAMQWLVRIAHDSEALQLVAVPLVEFMVSKDRGAAALRCADFVLEHGGVSPLLAAVALENALNQNQDSKALALWTQTLEQ